MIQREADFRPPRPSKPTVLRGQRPENRAVGPTVLPTVGRRNPRTYCFIGPPCRPLRPTVRLTTVGLTTRQYRRLEYPVFRTSAYELRVPKDGKGGNPPVTLSVETRMSLRYCLPYGLSNILGFDSHPEAGPWEEDTLEPWPGHTAVFEGSGCRVQGAGFWVQGFGCRVQGSGFRVGSLCDRKSVISSTGTPLCPFPSSYRRAFGLFTSGLFVKDL